MASLVEQRAILQELHTLGIADLSELMRRAAEFPDFFAFIVDAFPELVAQYASTSAELAAMWYEDAAPNLPYSAVPATVPTLEQFAESAKWALGSGGGNLAFAKLSGVLQRGVWGTARDTTVLNAESERGARYARHASANACEFCRMVATRGAVYTSAATASGVVGRGKDVSTNYDPVTGKRKRGGQAKGVRVRGSQKVGSKYHDNCVPAGTVVSGPAVNGAYRRLYEGEVVVIHTASGEKLTITPNHPVLTDSGWIPAGLLERGDNVVRATGGKPRAVAVPDEHHEPSLVEDVWGSFSVNGLVGVPGSSEDFHGDGSNGEVEIVGAYGLLRDRVQASSREPFGEFLLAGARGAGARISLTPKGELASAFPGAIRSPYGVVGGSSKFGSFLVRGAGHADGVGLTDGPNRNFEFFKSLSNHDPVGLESLRHFELRELLVDVEGPDQFWIDVNPVRARFDPAGFEFAAEGRLAYAELGGSLLRGLASQVELDGVVELERIGFRGHVYNLETSEGWYSASSLIVSNCRCMAVAVRPGKSYEPPPYVEKWEQEYVDAVRAASAAGRTKGEYGAIDVKAVMAAMRQNAK